MNRTLRRVIKKASAALVAIIMFCGSVCAIATTHQKVWEIDYTDNYVTSCKDATSVKISGRPNIRCEPIVADDPESNMTTSYGRVRHGEVELLVNKIYTEKASYGDRPLDFANGYFYGISVEDITQLPNWQRIFSENILKDKDGIIWINQDYIAINR